MWCRAKNDEEICQVVFFEVLYMNKCCSCYIRCGSLRLSLTLLLMIKTWTFVILHCFVMSLLPCQALPPHDFGGGGNVLEDLSRIASLNIAEPLLSNDSSIKKNMQLSCKQSFYFVMSFRNSAFIHCLMLKRSLVLPETLSRIHHLRAKKQHFLDEHWKVSMIAKQQYRIWFFNWLDVFFFFVTGMLDAFNHTLPDSDGC